MLNLAAQRRKTLSLENELRRQAELAQESAETILASIEDGFYALDSEWRFTYVNAAAERMLGRSRDTLIGMTQWERYPSIADNGVAHQLRLCMTERRSVTFEFLATTSERWFSMRVFPARDGGLSVYFRDITEYKRSEAELMRMNETLEIQVAQRTLELQAKEARLRTIFETSFTFQGLMTPDGRLLDANATSLKGIGASLQDVINRPFWETPWFTGTPGMSQTIRDVVPIVASGRQFAGRCV